MVMGKINEFYGYTRDELGNKPFGFRYYYPWRLVTKY